MSAWFLRRRLAAVAVLALLYGGAASAHVAPSLDDNNRYLKLSLFADRVRLAYTIFFGEVPGLAMRRSIDADRDGQLGDAETDAFARKLADQVAGQLAVRLDGAPVAVRFSQVSFGSATRAVSGTAGGGAFSVDLVATLCLPPRAAGIGDGGERAHRLELRDRFHLPRPGETEVHLEEGPGISIGLAAIGEHRAAERVFRFSGAVPALGEPGVQVELRVAPGTAAPRAGACEAQEQARQALRQGGRGGRRLLLISVGLAALVALIGGLRLAARRRARRSPSDGANEA